MAHYLVGLIPVGSTAREDYPLVQARCHYKVLDVYTIAEVVQDYYSSAPVNRDVEYVFPLPPSAAVCAFKAVIDDDKVIKGIVKEKGEAKKEYNEAVAQGKTAGLLQQEHADVFRVSLGNIKPKQKISIHISFVSIVTHDGNSPQSLRITMPTAIAPRYGAAPANIPWFGQNKSNRFELTVAVQMSKAVTSVSSPSHPIGLTLGCAEKELQGDYEPSKAFVHLGDSTFLDKDIVIVITAQGLDAPRCSVERWLATEGAEETTDAYALTLVPKFDLPALPNQEYVFLVDRSGSMEGGRMEAVKTGLQIMLRSLPSRNTTFNIVSFGSRYTSLWPKSQIYSAETVAEASKHVDTFTADYGGTELRSALQFAFSSRLALAPNATEKPPTSVFVLTDGEAWDLDGIINLVTENVEAAKKQDNLLRTFVLGVGNQVSTAMCEGIARAGKGTTVFVAEGEKPDAKLMNLLKAARGGVIENLAVEWGAAEEQSQESDDDFEILSGSTEAETAAPKTELPPLSLFDEGPSATDTAEVGPQKIVVQLAPPPVIQQAPKSDKLPIPLYPGFRCSIFAIIKQRSNSGPPSPSVKITGKVMGRDVAFQIPVVPIAIDSNATKDAMVGGKLLHTLAAKALIQVHEDMPTTAETKAQIERLGKRYSLASSVTSFLAIDHDSSSELYVSPILSVTRMEVDRSLYEGNSSSAIAPATLDRQMAPMTAPKYRMKTLSSSARGGGGMDSASPAPGMMGYGGLGAAVTGSRARPSPPPSAPAHSHSALPMRYTDTRGDYDGDDYAAAPRGGVGIVKALKRSFFSSAPSAPPASSAGPPASRLFYAMDSAVVTPPSPGASGSTSASASSEPLTLESIARAQQFDGSFPSNSAFLSQVCGNKAVPAMPAALSGLTGDAAMKTKIWATVLTLACLKRMFAGERDSWEMMAEKATGFVENELNAMGADGSAVCAALLASA